jgi:hypothetical protein
MENSCGEKKIYNAYFFINTEELEEDSPKNGDHNFVITDGLAEQLFNKETDFIFFPYSMLTIIEQNFQRAQEELSKYGVTDPIEQTIIENTGKYYPSELYSFEPTDPLAMERINFHGIPQIAYKKAAIIEHPKIIEEKFGSILSEDTYRSFLLKTITNKEFTLEVERFYKLFLGLKTNKRKLFDTSLGLYCLTSLDNLENSPIHLNNFTEQTFGTKEEKPDNNAWIDNLNSIFNTDTPNIAWSFFIKGHGEPDNNSGKTVVGGLQEEKMAKMLQFFNHAIPTNYVAVYSCHTNTKRLFAVLKKYTSILHLHFPLLASNSESATTSGGMRATIEHYYPSWFKAAHRHLEINDHTKALQVAPTKKELMQKVSNNNLALLLFISQCAQSNFSSFQPFSMVQANTDQHLVFDTSNTLKKHAEKNRLKLSN